MILSVNDIFHVHTKRCQHAEDIPDERYIEKAIELGAKSIWFTDHAPFPGDPFRNRMKYEELEEYIASGMALKRKYENVIPIFFGLEIEYFPSFDKNGYYKKLRKDPKIDCLLLGQHIAEDPEHPQVYTFSWTRERQKKEEHVVLADAINQAIQTGYFDVVAHPDRIFKRCQFWTQEMEEVTKSIINIAGKKNIPLEINMHSIKDQRYYWPEFWNLLTEDIKIISGMDAHSINQLERRYQRQQNFFCRNNPIFH